jgi:hypothetical protein
MYSLSPSHTNKGKVSRIMGIKEREGSNDGKRD